MGKLSQLNNLDASENQLKELPSGFGYLKALESLKLDNNHLEALPPVIGMEGREKGEGEGEGEGRERGRGRREEKGEVERWSEGVAFLFG
jgi:Leucine-rich repeat (LRR) protein